jgi:hypothetical protein
MTLDPILGRTTLGDVARERQLVQFVNGVDQCPASGTTDPCRFVTCGAGGICRTVPVDDGLGGTTEAAACGCVPGATARTTFAPDGTATVICQDRRMSFLNPGDQQDDMQALPDPCATFSCGAFGSCVSVNMTPTCVCQEGYVAIGGFDDSGVRQTTCVSPSEAIPDSFYDGRLPELPEDTPGGVEVDVPPMPGAAGESSTGGEAGTGGSATASSSGGAGNVGGAQGLGGSPDTGARRAKRGRGCAVADPGSTSPAWWVLAPLVVLCARRRAVRARSGWNLTLSG